MNVLDYSNGISTAFAKSTIENVEKAIEIIPKGGTIFTAGNGGSGSTASHFTQDLMKACNIPSYCLSDNIAFILATANDLEFSKIFSLNLSLNGRQGDTLVCISGSGNSMNLLEAVWTAKRRGMYTISLVGFTGGKLKEISDLTIHTAIPDMRQSESAHSIVLHYIVEKIVRGLK